MSKPSNPLEPARRWLIPLALLVVSLLVFWVAPRQMPDEPVRVEFENR